MKKIVMVVMLVLLLTSCDHTDLAGEVIVVSMDLSVGELIPLVLEVPEALNEIYRVEWLLHDENGDLINDSDMMIQGEAIIDGYDEAWIKDVFDIDEINVDRICLFLPKTAGSYTIDLYGFYKQTNPQPITEIDIEIVN